MASFAPEQTAGHDALALAGRATRAHEAQTRPPRREDRHDARRDTQKVAESSMDSSGVIPRERRSLYTFPNERALLGRRELRPFILRFPFD